MPISKQRVIFGLGGLAAGGCLALAVGPHLAWISGLALKPRLASLALLSLLLAYPMVLLLVNAWNCLQQPPRVKKIFLLFASALVGLGLVLSLRWFPAGRSGLSAAVSGAAAAASLVILLPLLLLVGVIRGLEWWERQFQTAEASQQLAQRYPLVFCAVFLALLLLPLLNFNLDLAQFQQEFWGAASLRRAYSGFRQALGDVYFDKVIVGQDGWLILSTPGSLDDYQRTNLFSEAELKAIQANLDATYAQLQAQGILFYVVLPPDKNTIYPEYLLPQIPQLGKTSRLEQLIAYQTEHGKAPIIDLRPALLAEKEQRRVYLTTDTHWNAYGALAATREMLLPLREKFPTLKVHGLEDYEKPQGIITQGDLARNSVPSAAGEEWFGLEPKFGRQWVRYNLSDQMPVIVSTVNLDPSLPRALIYHDSFMIWQYDFVADHFGKATFIWSYNVDVNFAVGEKADVVYLECTERYLDSLISGELTWNKD